MDFDLSDEDAFEGPDMIISDDGEVEDSGFSHGSFSSTSEGSSISPTDLRMHLPGQVYQGIFRNLPIGVG
jgi:hypothetical protein